jgi:two-component system, sensor histidine kinase ChiS
MSARDRMRVWEPYYRGSEAGRDINGLGIGLSLCKELVQQHQGSITLESEEGKGSLFRVELPLHVQDEKKR